MIVYLIHGSYGNPEENWFPWLKKELSDHQVITPMFPTPENQSFKNWLKRLPKLEPDSIVIGHSLGPAFLLKLLETNKVKAAFFVAPFVSPINNSDFDGMNKTFYREFNWNKIKENCGKFFIYHSDNDPYVPLEKAEEVAGNLDVTITIIHGAGHFNEASGYKQFPELLERIKKILPN
jgi:uncharacterized protein